MLARGDFTPGLAGDFVASDLTDGALVVGVVGLLFGVEGLLVDLVERVDEVDLFIGSCFGTCFKVVVVGFVERDEVGLVVGGLGAEAVVGFLARVLGADGLAGASLLAAGLGPATVVFVVAVVVFIPAGLAGGAAFAVADFT